MLVGRIVKIAVRSSQNWVEMIAKYTLLYQGNSKIPLKPRGSQSLTLCPLDRAGANSNRLSLKVDNWTKFLAQYQKSSHSAMWVSNYATCLCQYLINGINSKLLSLKSNHLSAPLSFDFPLTATFPLEVEGGCKGRIELFKKSLPHQVLQIY